MPKVFVQKWIEDETGWGERPDGYSLHLCLDDVGAFVCGVDEQEAHRLAEKSKIDLHAAFDEFSRPLGEPFGVEVDQATYEKIKQSQNGVKFQENWSKIEGMKDLDVFSVISFQK